MRQATGVLLSITVLLCAATPVDLSSIAQALDGGRYKEGLEMIESALRITPANPRLWLFRGKALDELGRASESARSYQRALSLRPDFTPALQGIAELQYKTANPEARITLQKLLSAVPQ